MPTNAGVPENRVQFSERIFFPEVRDAQKKIRELVEFRGFNKVELDFSLTAVAFPEVVMPILAFVRLMQTESIMFSLIPPHNAKLRRLFENANWAHLIDPRKWQKTDADVWNNLSVREFQNPDQQSRTVDQILDKILKATEFLEREHLRALEWSLQEITDNVMQHASVETGGLIQMSVHPNSKELEFTVADAGVGIPASLRTAFPNLIDDGEALREAIKEGVTRGTGQGNGLFGSFQICALSGGPFSINSGKAALVRDRSGRSITMREETQIAGSSISCTLSFAKPLLLERSLKIAGRPFSPTSDIIELQYEMESDDSIHFMLAIEARSVGSRLAGNEVRTKLKNLIRLSNGKAIVVDASNIGIMSSSFADEAFAKLAIELEPEKYRELIRFKDMQPINEQIIQRSLGQRLKALGF